MCKPNTNEGIQAGAILPREKAIEDALTWSRGQSYCFARDALDLYCTMRDLEWIENYQGIITFKELSL